MNLRSHQEVIGAGKTGRIQTKVMPAVLHALVFEHLRDELGFAPGADEPSPSAEDMKGFMRGHQLQVDIVIRQSEQASHTALSVLSALSALSAACL